MRKLLFLFLIAFPFITVSSQIDEKLIYDIKNTGYIHRPLPLDHSKSYETFAATKKVLVSEMLCDMEDLSKWTHSGVGGMRLTSERSISGKRSLRLVAPTIPEKHPGWGLGMGTSMASFDVGGRNIEKFNRVRLHIYPDCEGARSIYLNLVFENDGKIKVPDPYGREGIHEMNLVNGMWNECVVEIPELARDKVTKISLAIEIFGREQTMGDSLKFDIDAIELQVVEKPEIVSGWKPADDRIIFSTTGYGLNSEKTAIVQTNDNVSVFQLVDKSSSIVVYEGKVVPAKTPLGNFKVMDFTDFKTEGEYFIRTGKLETQPFYINKYIWENSAWRVINFVFVQRCGYPVPGKHGACHGDHHAEFNDKIFPVNGGWHDAADMSQQALQTGEVAFSLFEVANRAKENRNTDLYNRALEEALWGLDYILKTRLGDGYRVHNWGTNLWTDGYLGTDDDGGWHKAGVHNSGFENFLFAGIEAYAALSISHDDMLKGHLIKAATEDFGFALKRFEELGYAEMVNDWAGHAYMASESQYMATVSWAASQIYRLTSDKYYADKAAEFIQYVIKCQRTEALKDKDKLSGFFYRDLSRKSIVHYTHQSRDNVYMQALTELCLTQPGHRDYGQWENSVRLYGEYIKKIIKYVEPYGMLPSGVYNRNEIKDPEGFFRSQVGARPGPDSEKSFTAQLENGVKLDNDHYLRIFPIWYSFRGNLAVHLATGKNAALCGKLLKDDELINIAEQQLCWVVGKNPFGQSLIWGEGSNYAQQYTALPGETVGEIPVGMQSKFDEDIPYWPNINTAVYKEVWSTSAGKWLSLISEF